MMMARATLSLVMLLVPQACWSLRRSKLQKQRVTAPIPSSHAVVNFDTLDDFNLGEPCEASDFIVDVAGSSMVRKHYGSCALVGSVEALRGKSAGAAIDSHDTVIRVGEAPARSADGGDALALGGRTDVLFGAADARGPEGPVGAVVLGGEAAGPRAGAGGESSALPLARRSATTFSAAQDLSRLALGGRQPTSGLQALLTFLPVCDTVTLFGFEGWEPPDGPSAADAHDRRAELRIVRGLVDGQMPSDLLQLRDIPLSLQRVEECLRPRASGDAMLVHLHEEQ